MNSELRELQQIAGEAALHWNLLQAEEALGLDPSGTYKHSFEDLLARAEQVHGGGANKVAERLRALLLSLVMYSDARSGSATARRLRTMIRETMSLEHRRFVNLMRKLDPDWRPVQMTGLLE